MNQDDNPLTPPKTLAAQAQGDLRKARLAAALRDNLKRRKAQARAKVAPSSREADAGKSTD